jgi:hypothetical protein
MWQRLTALSTGAAWRWYSYFGVCTPITLRPSWNLDSR